MGSDITGVKDKPGPCGSDLVVSWVWPSRSPPQGGGGGVLWLSLGSMGALGAESWRWGQTKWQIRPILSPDVLTVFQKLFCGWLTPPALCGCFEIMKMISGLIGNVSHQMWAQACHPSCLLLGRSSDGNQPLVEPLPRPTPRVTQDSLCQVGACRSLN
ncbi:unnamed protein product [Rangifer tarandus platyrhynchus]|uniref:Uncharacterized protein n=1 Tax=Rangifer tarandus platyrhynchus TaxID=3082113 RepID=A0AC59ZV74_RANTA